jgi:ABC-type uncharacterized transport system permease subunit
VLDQLLGSVLVPGLALPAGWVDTLASAALAFAVPLLLAGVGECVVERAGVINIGIEGLMLVGALAAVVASSAAGQPWAGVAAGVLAAMAVAALFAYVTVWHGASQVVAGTAINLLALGVTGVVYGAITRGLAAQGVSRLEGVKLPDLPIPWFSLLPVVGTTLFSGNLLTYLALAAPVLAAYGLFRTRAGLQLRAVGEYPEAAEAAGLSVRGVRTAAILGGAALAGMGGAFLAIGHVVSFSENMIAGKGFIALALVIFGRWHPWGVMGGTLVFSLAWGVATALSAQGRGRPEEVWLLALPYLATLVALAPRSAGHGRRGGSAPAALGRPYPVP